MFMTRLRARLRWFNNITASKQLTHHVDRKETLTCSPMPEITIESGRIRIVVMQEERTRRKHPLWGGRLTGAGCADTSFSARPDRNRALRLVASHSLQSATRAPPPYLWVFLARTESHAQYCLSASQGTAYVNIESCKAQPAIVSTVSMTGYGLDDSDVEEYLDGHPELIALTPNVAPVAASRRQPVIILSATVCRAPDLSCSRDGCSIVPIDR